MYKVINLNDLSTKKFQTEREALIFVDGLATALSFVGYRIPSMPMSCGISYDTPQFLKAIKTGNDDNDCEEVITFALMSYDRDECIIVTKENVNDTWGADTESDFNVRRTSEKIEQIEKGLKDLGYAPMRTKNTPHCYIQKTDMVTSEIYILKDGE